MEEEDKYMSHYSELKCLVCKMKRTGIITCSFFYFTSESSEQLSGDLIDFIGNYFHISYKVAVYFY